MDMLNGWLRGRRIKGIILTALILSLSVMVCRPSGYACGAAGGAQTVTDDLKPAHEIPEVSNTASSRRQMAVIIDDFGNGLRGTQEMLELPVKITVAIMPFLSTTQQDARLAHERGFDVLLHLPMEPKSGKPEWLGPGAILTRMSDDEVRRSVEAALDNVPYAVGINNHMGSKVTGDERVMRIILSVCRERGLVYVDSRTNYRSVAGRLAEEAGLPRIENHLFLDDIHNERHVLNQVRKAYEYADGKGYVIAIGHVGIQGRSTAAGLRQGIAEIGGHADFVGISDLARIRWGWTPYPTLP